MNILLSRKGIDTAALYATMDRQAALEDTENLAGSDKQCPFQSVIPNPTTRRGLVSGIFAFWKHLRPLAPKQLLCQVLSDEHTQYKTLPGSWRCLQRRLQPAAGAGATSQPPRYACAPGQLDQGIAPLLPLPPAPPAATGGSF